MLHADSSPGVLTTEMQNWVKKGQEGVTWPNFEILGPPPYLGNGLRYKCQIWHADSSPGELTTEMLNYVKLGQEGVTWPTLEIFGFPPYLRNSWARNVKFCMQVHHQGY